MINTSVEQNSTGEVALHLGGNETTALVESVQTWRYSVDSRQWGFFLAKRKKCGCDAAPRRNTANAELEENCQSPISTPNQIIEYEWTIGSLANYERGFFEGFDPDDRFVCFADPSTYRDYPGWMLRNLLVLIHRRWSVDVVQILCYRDVQSRRDDPQSIILKLKLEHATAPMAFSTTNLVTIPSNMPKVTGWERNSGGKLTSKIANLGEYMDPQRYNMRRGAPIL